LLGAAQPMIDTLRLFFAVWPDERVAAKLERWASEASRAAGGRVTRAQTIHLTLAFLGEVPSHRLPAALDAAKRVDVPAHAFAIEQARFWAHNRIVWVGPREVAGPLADLAAQLRRELQAEGFRLETRPFAAHVTLIRKACETGPLPQLPKIDWPVSEFVLVCSTLSREGPKYEVLGRFRLAPAV
jgi:2'-5' RNA ligase